MTFTPQEAAAWVSIVKDATVTGILLFVLWGGSRQVWVWGHHYADAVRRLEDARQDIRWWQERHLGVLETADRAVTLAERRRPTR